MKILMLNWRDIKNPLHGGAEIVTHEHLKRWVKAGHECILFTSEYPGCKKEEMIEGYKVIRKGNKITVYWQAYKYYKKRFKGNVDLVIDQVNTIPFFTPLYVKEKKVSFFHQLCRSVWFYELPLPLSLIGYLLEPLYLRFYKNYPSITVSESTKQDLNRYGIKNVNVIPEGINFKPLDKIPVKEKNTLIYVGRLKKSKRVHHIIKALSFVKEKIPDIRLNIIGNGDFSYKNYLKKLLKKYNLEKNVRSFGYVNFARRNELMSKAEAIIVTSVREGWGLIVTEANAMGTPAIVYDVPGLRDSVNNDKTGLITKTNNPNSLSKAIIRLLKDDELKNRLSKNALKLSKQFNWDKSAKESLNILRKLK